MAVLLWLLAVLLLGVRHRKVYRLLRHLEAAQGLDLELGLRREQLRVQRILMLGPRMR